MSISPKKTYNIKKKAILATSGIQFATTKEKGDVYEIFIKHLLIDSGDYKMVHLWKDIPESDLFASGIMDDWNTARIRRKVGRTEGLIGDIGTDLLVMDNTGKYSIVQCKYYDEDARLRIEDLGTFYFMMMNYHNIINGIVYHTCKLSSLLESHRTMNTIIQYNQEPFNLVRYLELLDTIYKPVKTEANTKLIPFDYQLEAITALQGKQRTVCQIPCGCGKTLIAIKLCEAYNQNVIITPLKSYCEQNLERFQSQMDGSYQMMVVDSDGDGRNIDKIQEFIKANQKFCLFTTFKSVDIINKLINDGLLNKDEYFIVIDEFHNISINDILEDEEEINTDSGKLDIEKDDIEEDNMEEDDIEEDFEEKEEINTDSDELDIEKDNIEEDNIEEDNIEENNNTEMYKLLHSNAKILFMSATPKLYGNDNGYNEDYDIDEEIFGNIDYKMQMHDAIATGKICDYMVYVPTLSIEKIFGLDKIQEEVNISEYDNELVKELVIKAQFIIRGMMNNGGRRCIIYLQTKEECKKMNTILADVGKKYFAIDINSNYIISDLDKDERKLVLKEFVATGGYNFLCSVDILNECIDIPECDSIFIAYPSKSKIRNIQRVCRANRLDKKNIGKVAGIYVWADEYKDDLVDFLGHLKEYDEGFSFNKVKRLNVVGKKDAVMKVDDNMKESKSLEGLVVGVKGINSWSEKLDEVKKFIDDNGRRPNKTDNKYLQIWLWRMISLSRTRKLIMKNDKIYLAWNNFIHNTKYRNYFNINFTEIWKSNLQFVKEFIDINKARPTEITNIKLASWLSHQVNISKKRIAIMKDDIIYNIWQQFINDVKYKKYFDIENIKIVIWIDILKELKSFIDVNNARPTINSNTKLNSWIIRNIDIYKTKLGIMKYETIYNLWNEFISNVRYKKYFDLDNNRDWKIKLEEVKKFILENKVRPTENTNKSLDSWIQTQITNSKRRIKIMKNDEIYNLWCEFSNDSRFNKFINIDNIAIWNQYFNKLKAYIDTNNKLPSEKVNKELYIWYQHQISIFKKKCYIMKNDEIYKIWSEFINNKNYSKFFIDNETHWKKMFEKLKNYLDTNNSRPTKKNNQELDSWLKVQITTSNKKINIMKNETIYNLWKLFINEDKYNVYFMNNDKIWTINLNKLKLFIDKNQTKPTELTDKELFNWIRTQKANYKNMNKIFKNKEILRNWVEFINDDKYKKYFK